MPYTIPQNQHVYGFLYGFYMVLILSIINIYDVYKLNKKTPSPVMVALGFPENHPHVVLGFALKEAQASGCVRGRHGPGAVARCTQSSQSHGFFMGFWMFLFGISWYIYVYLRSRVKACYVTIIHTYRYHKPEL